MGLGDDGTNDDDWLNPDEEKKDYSGLKIGTLKIEEKDNKEPEEEHEINEEGERVPVKKSGDVWAQKRNEQNASKDNSRDSSPHPGSEKPSEPSPPVAAPASAAGEATKPASTGGYVPPHLRGGAPR